MKKLKTWYYIVLFLPLAAALICLPFLPDNIPAHFGFDGTVDRWGSKYETMILPVCTIGLGYFMLLIGKLASRQEKQGQNNEKICLVIGLLCSLLFLGFTLFILYIAFAGIERMDAMALDANQLSMLLIGIMLLVLGNLMPKAKMNSVLGLRTSWSMQDEITWKQCQRFGGISAMICGGILVVLGLFLRGMGCTLIGLGLMMAMAIIDTVYSARAARRNRI